MPPATLGQVGRLGLQVDFVMRNLSYCNLTKLCGKIQGQNQHLLPPQQMTEAKFI